MSEEAALGVGQSIAAATVHSVEDGFHEEHLELTERELDVGRGGDEQEEGQGQVWREPD